MLHAKKRKKKKYRKYIWVGAPVEAVLLEMDVFKDQEIFHFTNREL